MGNLLANGTFGIVKLENLKKSLGEEKEEKRVDGRDSLLKKGIIGIISFEELMKSHLGSENAGSILNRAVYVQNNPQSTEEVIEAGRKYMNSRYSQFLF